MPDAPPCFRSAALAGLLALAACGGGERRQSRRDRQRADRQRRRSGADQRARGPDPGRSQSRPAGPSQQRPAARDAGPGAISGRRPARRSGGARAQQRRRRRPRAPPSAAACGARFDYGAQWASRLPAEFPAYPGGRVTEAAGNDHGDCRMRVVTFTTARSARTACSNIIAASPPAPATRPSSRRAAATRCSAAPRRRRRLLSDRDPGRARLRSRADRQQRALSRRSLAKRARAALHRRPCPIFFSSCSAARSAPGCAIWSAASRWRGSGRAFPGGR